MPLPLGLTLLAIDINQKLTAIDPKLKGTILNLFSRTGNDYSLAVNSTDYKLKFIELITIPTLLSTSHD